MEPSLRIFEGVTERWGVFFKSLKPSDWLRRFQNSEWGTLTVEDVAAGDGMAYAATTPRISRSLRKRMGW